MAENHVFADQDAAVIYRGLMQIVGAVRDLKEVVVAMDESVGRLIAALNIKEPADTLEK